MAVNYYLIAYLALIGFVLIGHPLGLFPKVKWNGKGSLNNWFKVEMAPAAYYRATNQSMQGVYAQERTESWLNWWMQSAFSAIVAIPAFLFFDPRVALGAGFLVLILSHGFTNKAWFNRQQELIGHAVEIVVAPRDGFDTASYFDEEASRVWGNQQTYGYLFKGWTEMQFRTALRKRLGLAKFLASLQSVALRNGSFDK